MKTTLKSTLMLMASTFVLMLAFWHIDHRPPSSPRQAQLKTRQFGDMAVARPASTLNGLTVLFADSQHFPLQALALRITETGSAAAVIDNASALQTLSSSGQRCLDTQAVQEMMQLLGNWADARGDEKRIVAGIGEGALLAFLASQAHAADNTEYLSIDFSAKLPSSIEVCPPFVADKQGHVLRPGPEFGAPPQGHWRAVWTDQPPDETAVFVRSIPHADTGIAPYDTPLDQVALDEISRLLGKTDASTPPLPIVEVPASHPSQTMTLFYSGDGGWRDLDRAVAQDMARAGFPVAGVDVLRYFWERKSPEQAARDLAAAMAYYRKTQGTQSFVLAGYSFGADILPAVFNRLPEADRDAVKLLVLLATAEKADFEIHVTGWLGQEHGDLPLASELARIPANKLMCVYGEEEKNQQGCKGLENSAAELLELPGGHHFDQDYPKLAQHIIDVYRSHGLK